MADSADNSGAQRPRKVVGRPFAPGVSPNPGGRPKALAALQALAQAETEANVKTLITLRDDKKQPGAVRAAVIQMLFDRGYGKPSQSHEVRHNLAAATAADAALLAIAIAGGGVAVAAETDQDRPDGVVH